MKKILEKTRIYLVGAIEDCSEGGKGWRDVVSERLESLGMTVFNPLNKPFEIDVDEVADFQAKMKKYREDQNWDKLSEKMHEIRIYDLKLVDISDAIFVYLDADIMTCGSWEEVFTANRSKKPIFFVYKQGKKNIPTWMFGTIPHRYFYDSIEEAISMLEKINSGEVEIDSDRWKLLRKEYR